MKDLCIFQLLTVLFFVSGYSSLLVEPSVNWGIEAPWWDQFRDIQLLDKVASVLELIVKTCVEEAKNSKQGVADGNIFMATKAREVLDLKDALFQSNCQVRQDSTTDYRGFLDRQRKEAEMRINNCLQKASIDGEEEVSRSQKVSADLNTQGQIFLYHLSVCAKGAEPVVATCLKDTFHKDFDTVVKLFQTSATSHTQHTANVVELRWNGTACTADVAEQYLSA